MEKNIIEKKDVLIRLKKIQGQVNGIYNMVEKDAPCKDVLVQIAAIRAAINKVGGMVIQNYATKCLNIEEAKTADNLEDLLSTFLMFLK